MFTNWRHGKCTLATIMRMKHCNERHYGSVACSIQAVRSLFSKSGGGELPNQGQGSLTHRT